MKKYPHVLLFPKKAGLINQLTDNRISRANLNKLMEAATSDDLKEIVLRIFDMNEAAMLEKSAVDGSLRWLNALKNERRRSRYNAQIKRFAHRSDPLKKIVAEGDSWFNYPIVLSDIIDFIAMENDTAVYSLAAGGDWLLNMIAAREYVDGLSVHQPEFFLMSGGGNDVGGMSRVAMMVNKSKQIPTEFSQSKWAEYIIEKARDKPDAKRWENALPYLSKDFFALLMLFRLQYYYLFSGLLVQGKKKFPNLKIITQGYDFLVPSDKKGWGLNPFKWYVPALRWLGHGSWLQMPLLIKGIADATLQKDILYAFMFLFNEMMIELGYYFTERHGLENQLFHIDSRGLVGPDEWTDEIHPQPQKFKIIAQTYLDCMNGKDISNGHFPDYDHVYRSLNRLSQL